MNQNGIKYFPYRKIPPNLNEEQSERTFPAKSPRFWRTQYWYCRVFWNLPDTRVYYQRITLLIQYIISINDYTVQNSSSTQRHTSTKLLPGEHTFEWGSQIETVLLELNAVYTTFRTSGRLRLTPC